MGYGLWAVTTPAAGAVIGRVTSIFRGLGDLFSIVRGGIRTEIGELIEQGAARTSRADDINLNASFSSYLDLHDLDYATLVTIEDRLDGDDLAKLNDRVDSTPGLASAIDADLTLVDTWKFVNDAGTCSFDGHMEIHARGGMVPIQDLIARRDYVLAKDELTGRIDYKLVTAVYSNVYQMQVLITTVSDATGEIQIVISNEIHPIFAQPLKPSTTLSSEGYSYKSRIVGGQWIDARNLSIGDKILNADASFLTVSQVDMLDSSFRAYNLSVNDYHTYFVSGSDSSTAFWVHNTCFAPILNDRQLLENFHENLRNILELRELFETDPSTFETYQYLAVAGRRDTVKSAEAIEQIHDMRNNQDVINALGAGDSQEADRVLGEYLMPKQQVQWETYCWIV